MPMPVNRDPVSARLVQVSSAMARALAPTILTGLDGGVQLLLGPGKMLRARLALRLGSALQIPDSVLIPAATAVELVHAASLLHDDVIDGALLRRHAPAFWKTHGVHGAILAGDVLLIQAIGLLSGETLFPLANDLVRFCAELCNAEAEQELFLRQAPPGPDKVLDIARRKTGALFAFAAGAAAGPDAPLRLALHEAGYALGTAYQLADDLLDETGDEHSAGKTLGLDRARCQPTAARIFAGGAPALAQKCQSLHQHALAALAPWTEARDALRDYLDQDMNPALRSMIPQLSPNPQEVP